MIMQISPVTEADLGQLAALYEQLGSTGACIDSMKAALQTNYNAGNPVIFVAKIEGRVAGTLLAATCQMLFGECRSFMVVEDVVVDAAHRRQGIGKALMQHAEEFAKERNCSYIMLVTDTHRTASQAFYNSLGYKSAEYCAFKKHLMR
jgi:ribosomal protein S18 acetylase RimI-like enzyme